MGVIDVLFINPRFEYAEMGDVVVAQPTPLVALAAWLREKKYSVAVIDANAERLTKEQLLQQVKEYAPRIVCLPMVTVLHEMTIELANSIKKTCPEARLIAGGPHYYNFPRWEEPFDAIVHSPEGELPLEGLAGVWLRGRELKEVPGIATKEFKTELPKLLPSIDEMPFPAYDLLKGMKEPYLYQAYPTNDYGRKFASLITSRGCWGRCTFCSSAEAMQRTWRGMSAKKLFEFLSWLEDTFGCSHFYFQDDEWSVNKMRVKEFCNLIIESKKDWYWECLSRANDFQNVFIDNVRLMAQAGCKSIAMGVESGTQETLDKIKKDCTLDDYRRAVAALKKHGIEVRASFIMGFPWETEEHIRKTIEFAKELKPDICYFQILVPYPNTPLYQQVVDAGTLTIEANNYASWIQHSIVGTEPIVRTLHLSTEDLKRLNAEAFRTIYYNPWFVARKFVKSWNRPGQLWRFGKIGWQLLLQTVKRGGFTHEENKPAVVEEKKEILVEN